MHKLTRWEWPVTKMSNVNLDLLGWASSKPPFDKSLPKKKIKTDKIKKMKRSHPEKNVGETSKKRKTYTCEECTQPFTRKDRLETHIQNNHLPFKGAFKYYISRFFLILDPPPPPKISK